MSGIVAALQLEPAKGRIRALTAPFTVRVNGVCGHLCNVKLAANGHAKDLMMKITRETGANWWEQLLVVGTRVLEHNDPVHTNSVVMVRRDMARERYHWLKMLKRKVQPPYHLREDKEFMLMAARIAPRVIAGCIPEKLRSCTELGIALVQESGLNLELLPAPMRADRTVVRAAVTNTGFALRFAAEDLREDFHTCLAAVGTSPNARRHVNVSIRKAVEAEAERLWG